MEDSSGDREGRDFSLNANKKIFGRVSMSISIPTVLFSEVSIKQDLNSNVQLTF